MLVENTLKIKENDIVSFKLVTTEEIVAKVVRMDDNSYTIKNPLVLMLSHDGKIAVGNFMIGIDKDVELSLGKNSVVIAAKSNKQLTTDYIQMTTGIHVGASGII